MSLIDQFRYDGKRVLVVGGATGMGAAAAKATAELGAEVIVMDRAPVEYPVDQEISVDLSDPASIDAAIEQIEGPVNAVFSAAGVADGPAGPQVLMRINFIGHRHLIDRLLAEGRLPKGSAICFISSLAGIGWENDLERVQEFLATTDYQSADEWIGAHVDEGIIHYGFSKKAINVYVAQQSYPFMAKGVRINAICPGPTDTPLSRANADLWLAFGQDYREATGTDILTPEQMANAMVFLNSDAAGGVSGVNLLVDVGHAMASMTGSFAPGKPIIDLIMGKVPLG